MTREERALKNLKQMCSDGRYLGSGSHVPSEVLEDFDLAIKALEQEPETDRVEYGTDGNAYRLTISNGKELEQEPNMWSFDDAREDFKHDVYNTLDFLPTNNEANQIIDSFDRVTSSIKQEPVLDKIGAEIEEYKSRQLTLAIGVNDLEKGKQVALEYTLAIIDKYKAESEK